ncbi:hypothetical protein [Actinomyces howellii]|uniref:Uncharacterized protein n=1 Tax=Actinomyces howellii TaxID=52771 RepID=A0A448HH46_9ACTO|nr:hypothetical protein [Actinomyces howellii]VEG28312.1 Uncharacterised protein [Actinomyces howellii]
MNSTTPSSLARSLEIREAVAERRYSGIGLLRAGTSLLQVLAMAGSAVLVLLGVLMGGRAFVAAVDPSGLVTHTSTVVAASTTADLREPATRGRES